MMSFKINSQSKEKYYRQKGQHVVNRSEFISSLSLQREKKCTEKKYLTNFAGDIEFQFLSRIIIIFFIFLKYVFHDKILHENNCFKTV